MTTAVEFPGTRRNRRGRIAVLAAGAVLVLLAALAPLLGAARDPAGPDAPQEIASVEDLWRGFDPEATPLDVETIRAWEEDGVAYQTLRFTGEGRGDAKVRVYAIQGAPREGKGLPGVLHVHGGGQTASLDWVRFWAKRGYVCVSFDFCGRWEKRTDFTDWGPIKQGNMAEAAGGFQLRPTPRESSWYHWTLVSRRALTLLARHPQADPKRLGVFGVSVGGSLTWMIAGSDPRVKAAVPIYGCGYNYDRRNARWGLLVPNDDYNLFQRVLSPEAHAPFVSCPMLFLSATNDGHGLMDRAYDALGATTGPTYQAFSPRTDHHVEPREGRDLALWMDWQLKGGAAWPASPDLRLALDTGGTPTAAVVARRPGRRDRGRCVLRPGRQAAAGAVLAAGRGDAAGQGMAGRPARHGRVGRSAGLRQRDLPQRRLPQHAVAARDPRAAGQGAGDSDLAAGARPGRRRPRPLEIPGRLHGPQCGLGISADRPRREGRPVHHIQRRASRRTGPRPALHAHPGRPAVPGPARPGAVLPGSRRLHGRGADAHRHRTGPQPCRRTAIRRRSPRRTWRPAGARSCCRCRASRTRTGGRRPDGRTWTSWRSAARPREATRRSSPACAGWTPPDSPALYRRREVHHPTRPARRWVVSFSLGVLALAARGRPPTRPRRFASTRPTCRRAACRRPCRSGPCPTGCGRTCTSATCRRAWGGCPRRTWRPATTC